VWVQGPHIDLCVQAPLVVCWADAIRSGVVASSSVSRTFGLLTIELSSQLRGSVSAGVVCALMSINDSVFGTVLRVHASIYEHTDGLIGHRVLGVPCLMLRTTGRKTGQTRTNSLVYAKDDDRYIVVASKGGDPKAPAWLLNLRAKPEVDIQIGRTHFPATAAEIGLGDPDYGRLWQLVNDKNSNRYDEYQKKTTRPIPLVALTRST
jgi:deazaflavin-dependent oxidoreductase (nitroreductase family)